MLILTRKSGEKITIGSEIEITVVEIKGKQIRLGIQAPKSLTIHRNEVFERIKNEQKDISSHIEVNTALIDSIRKNHGVLTSRAWIQYKQAIKKMKIPYHKFKFDEPIVPLTWYRAKVGGAFHVFLVCKCGARASLTENHQISKDGAVSSSVHHYEADGVVVFTNQV